MSLFDRLSKGWKAWILLFLLTFGAAAPGVFLLPALDRDESRFAQASKEMLEEQDFIRIQYQDELRNKKPAGIHWLQAGSTALLTGPEARAIWTYRVPSWFGAAGATLACFWAGMALIGRRPAFIGSLLFGTTLLLTSEAHIAKTDAVLVFLTTLGTGALGRLYTHTTRPKQMALLFWACMGAGFLIKGPVTPMVAAFAGLGAWVWNRNGSAGSHEWWRILAWWPGPVLFLLMVLPWFVWIQIATGGLYLDGAVGKDLKDKFAGASEGHGGLPGYHIMHLPAWFFPAGLLLPAAMIAATRRLRGQEGESIDRVMAGLRFLACWAAGTWVFFEFLPTKLSHYILPAYPALALICGYAADRLLSGDRMPVALALGMFIFGLGALVLLSVSYPGVTGYLMAEAASDFTTVSAGEVLGSWRMYEDFPLWLWWAGFILSGLVLTEAVRRRLSAAILLALAAALVIGWHIRIFMLPSQAWVQPSLMARLALEDVCGVPGEDGLCNVKVPSRVLAIGYAEPSYVMTLGTQNLHQPQTPLSLPDDMSAYPVVYLINFEDRKARPSVIDIAASLRAQGRELGLCLTEGEARYALNYSNGDPVHFRAWRFDAGACP